MEATIHLADTEALLTHCYPVMQELRPHLSEAEFVAQVIRQQAHGYRLAFLVHDGVVRAVTGFRMHETLAWGLMTYVDDLVTRSMDHGHGFGSALLDWVIEEAKRLGCSQLHLDSGVQRFGAHRFYLHKGMDITCHHFGLKL